MNEETNMISKEIGDIYQRHVDTIYKVCFILLKNVSDTEDAVQSVFIKLMQSNKTFVDYEHEKAWLIRTAQNHCKNILGHWWSRKKVSIDLLPEQSIPKRNELKDIWRRVLDLPTKYKAVVFLFYYEGYSTKEIAQILEIKESTIRSQLHTARKLLKINLDMEGHRYASRRVESSH